MVYCVLQKILTLRLSATVVSLRFILQIIYIRNSTGFRPLKWLLHLFPQTVNPLFLHLSKQVMTLLDSKKRCIVKFFSPGPHRSEFIIYRYFKYNNSVDTICLEKTAARTTFLHFAAQRVTVVHKCFLDKYLPSRYMSSPLGTKFKAQLQRTSWV